MVIEALTRQQHLQWYQERSENIYGLSLENLTSGGGDEHDISLW